MLIITTNVTRLSRTSLTADRTQHTFYTELGEFLHKDTFVVDSRNNVMGVAWLSVSRLNTPVGGLSTGMVLDVGVTSKQSSLTTPSIIVAPRTSEWPG